MFKFLSQLLFGNDKPHTNSQPQNEFSSSKSYAQRYEETEGMTTEQIRSMIAQREAEEKDCGVAYAVLGDRSDRKAAEEKIDPPRPGRKTYQQRYEETHALSVSEIKALIAEREAQGKESGVLYRVLSERL